MKKILFFLLCLMFIPFVYAKDNVSIESIELIDHDAAATEHSAPTFEGLDMNFDVAFGEVDAYVKYKIVVNNDTDQDYVIADRTLFNESHYIKYVYEVEDTLKAHSSTVVNLTISYDEEVDPDDFVEGKYIEDNTATVKLLNNDGEEIAEVNPSTNSSGIMFIILGVATILFVASVIMLFKGRNTRYIGFMMIFALIAVPFVAKAIEELVLQANVKVEIKAFYSASYSYVKTAILREDEVLAAGYEFYQCNIIYKNEYTEENKYYACRTGVTVEDTTKYEYGDRFEVQSFPVSYVYYDGCPTTYNPSTGETYFICPEERFIYTTATFEYRWPRYVYDQNNYFIESKARDVFDLMEYRNADGDLLDFDDFYMVRAGDTFKVLDYNVDLYYTTK